MNKKQFGLILAFLAVVAFLLIMVLIRVGSQNSSSQYQFGGNFGGDLVDVNNDSLETGDQEDTSDSSDQVASDDDTLTLTLYFADSGNLSAERGCTDVYPVLRTVPATTGVARAAINALIQGPTADEIALGYETAVPEDMMIRDIAVNQQTGFSYVDFEGVDDADFNSLCEIDTARAQIIATFKQFPTVGDAVIYVEGNPRNIFFQ